MYPEHFQLRGRPFVGGPTSRFMVPNAQVAAAVAHLQEALMSRDAIALVSGGPGVGKSALLEHAQKELGEKTVLALGDLRQSEPEDLLDSLLLSLGEEAGDGSGPKSWNLLRRAISRHNEAGRMVTAAIDVNGITADRARRLLRLAYLMGEPGMQLNLVLHGPHILHKLLDVPGLIHLRQRVVYRHRVRPFTPQETTDYLATRVKAAGGNPNNLFDGSVANFVYLYVAGVPRLINSLMEASFTEAAVRQDKKISGSLVEDVAQTLGWKPLAARGNEARKPASNAASSPATTQTAANKTAAPKAEQSADLLPIDKMGVSATPATNARPAPAVTQATRPAAQTQAGPTPAALQPAARLNPAATPTNPSPAAVAAEPKPPGPTAVPPVLVTPVKTDNDPGFAALESTSEASALETAAQKAMLEDASADVIASPQVAAQATHSELSASLSASMSSPTADESLSSANPDLSSNTGENLRPAHQLPPAGIPEMDPNDHTATGMLRLEDLTEGLAESLFSEEGS